MVAAVRPASVRGSPRLDQMYRSFAEICRVVKPGGRFYVWVYRLPETFVRRYLKYPLFDLVRLMISRLPEGPQAVVVRAWANLIYGVHRVAHGEARVPYSEYVVSAYDDMTPRWRRYHTAYELAGWFHKNGFGSPVLSHWDNPYGFGLVAVKNARDVTPGIHYGSAPKLWDEEQTLVALLTSKWVEVQVGATRSYAIWAVTA